MIVPTFNNVSLEAEIEYIYVRLTLLNTYRESSSVLFAYLFFQYLAKLIIFTRSSRIPCVFFLEGGFKGIYLRERNFTLSYVVSEI